MLKLNFFIILLLGVMLISCKKEPVISSTQPTAQEPPIPTPTPQPPTLNLVVYAGSDSLLQFPVNSITLKGSAQTPQIIDNIIWKKNFRPGFVCY